MDPIIWQKMPHDVFRRTVGCIDDMDTRRAFGVYKRLSMDQLSLPFQAKRILKHEVGASIRWVIGGKVFILCRVFKETGVHECVATAEGGIGNVLWESII